MADKRKIYRVDATAPKLKIEEGKVVEVQRPILEEMEIEETDSGALRHVIHTANGDAIYEFAGNCWDCANEKKEVPVFKCVTDPLRADEQLGNQLAGFWNDGTATPLCQLHYAMRLGRLPQQTVTYEVIEKRW